MCWAWSVRSCFGPFLINPDWMKWQGVLNTVEFGRNKHQKHQKMGDQHENCGDCAVIIRLADWWLLPKILWQPPNDSCVCKPEATFWGVRNNWVCWLRPDIFTYNNILAKCARTAPENSLRNCETKRVALSCKACELDLVVGVLMRRVRYLDPSVLRGSCSRHTNPGGWHRFVLRCDILAWAHEGSRLDNGKWLCSLSHLYPFATAFKCFNGY